MRSCLWISGGLQPDGLFHPTLTLSLEGEENVHGDTTGGKMEGGSMMSTHGFSILALTAKDVALMQKLLGVFGEAFDEQETYGEARPGAAYLKRLLGREYFIALAALVSDEVVGGLVAYVLDKFEQERSEIYIYDLAVAAAHRRRGIATALVRALQTMAAQRGAHVIFVQADQGDAPAVALYSRLGKREEVLHFDIDVQGRGA